VSTIPKHHVRSLPEAQYIPTKQSTIRRIALAARVGPVPDARHHHLARAIGDTPLLHIPTNMENRRSQDRIKTRLFIVRKQGDHGTPAEKRSRDCGIQRIAADVIRPHSWRLTRREGAVAIPPPCISLSGFLQLYFVSYMFVFVSIYLSSFGLIGVDYGLSVVATVYGLLFIQKIINNHM
jgi:hypothetical protein